MSLKQFVSGYIEAALFSSNDDDEVPLDKNYDARDIAPETLRQMELDCATFYEANDRFWASSWDDAPDVSAEESSDQEGLDDEQAGRDFWFTRNGHGVGFWDRDELNDYSQKYLSAESKRFGTFDLYIGDDGEIHGSPLSSAARATAMAGLGASRGAVDETADAEGLGAVKRGLGFWNPR